jgi:hypothetical protein
MNPDGLRFEPFPPAGEQAKEGRMVRWGAAAVLVAAGCSAGGPRTVGETWAPPVDESAVLEVVTPGGVGESVLLRFDWPDGLEGRCRSRRRVVGDGRLEPAREVTFRVRVERTPDEVRIVTDDLAGDADRLLGEDAPGPLVEVVGPDGRYRTAEGVEAAVATVGSVDRGSAAARALAAAQVRDRLALTWKLLVGAWAGRELPLGAAYAATAPEALPGGESLRVRIAIQADGRVPCRAGESDARCVRLRIYSQPEESAPPALVPGLLDVLAPGAGLEPDLVVPTAAFIANSAVVVTDPDTLIPQRFVLRRRFVLAASAPDAPSLRRERGEEITRVCAWR